MKKHSEKFLQLVNEAKKQIREISPKQLKERLDRQESFQLIDVRELDEWNTGKIPSAIHLSKGIIERDIEKLIPNNQQEIIIYCSGGFRCALVAESLQKMGYDHVYSLDSGLQGWLNEGYGLEKTN